MLGLYWDNGKRMDSTFVNCGNIGIFEKEKGNYYTEDVGIKAMVRV